MKQVIFLFILICCINEINAQEPLIKFYLQDGSLKKYNISEIENIVINHKSDNLMMEIYYQDSLFDDYFIETFDSLSFYIEDNVYYFSIISKEIHNNYSLNILDSIRFVEIEQNYDDILSDETIQMVDSLIVEPIPYEDIILPSGEKVIDFLKLNDSLFLKEQDKVQSEENKKTNLKGSFQK